MWEKRMRKKETAISPSPRLPECPCKMHKVHLQQTTESIVQENEPSIPLKIHPRGQGHHFVAIKRGVLRKTYRMIGFQWFFLLTKWWGRVHQPPLFITPPFCTEVYLARMFDLYFFLNVNFAFMLGPCAPKKAPFCKNLFLCHFPSFSQLSLRSNPSFL